MARNVANRRPGDPMRTPWNGMQTSGTSVKFVDACGNLPILSFLTEYIERGY